MGINLTASLLGCQTFCDETLCVVIFFHGVATGSIIPSILNVTLQNVPTHFAGAASGVYTTPQQASSALGISIIAGLFFTVLNRQADFAHYYKAFKYASMANIGMLMIMSVYYCSCRIRSESVNMPGNKHFKLEKISGII